MNESEDIERLDMRIDVWRAGNRLYKVEVDTDNRIMRITWLFFDEEMVLHASDLKTILAIIEQGKYKL